MIRFGLGILVATTACAAFGVAACGDTIKDPGNGASSGGAANTGGGGSESGGSTNNGGSTGTGAVGSGLTFPTSCQGACCPTDDTCYAGPNKGDKAGGECMATHINDLSKDDHIQMRQAWIRALTPIGNTQSTVYNVLAGRTELPAPNCYQGRSPLGSGGYMQLIDFYLGGSKATPKDFSKDYSMVGYATQITAANLQDDLTKGFCMGVDAAYPGDAKYRLPGTGMSPSADYPVGLPHPMGLSDGPWKVGPTKAKRLDADFDLKSGTKRVDLLKQLDKTTGEYGMAGFDGVFFYDPIKGYAHGYGSMGWTIVYALDGKSHLSIPIREVETRSTFNDPQNPNCVGEYRGGALDPAGSPKCGSSDQNDPAWGGGNCGDHKCDPGKKDAAGKPAPEAPATTEGYFLITELQQIYSPDLSATLCVTYPTAAQMTTEGFYDAPTFGCVTPNWDPTKADGSGIPRGDWCAATNSAATPTGTCHDAWKSRSNHVFIGGKIQVPAVASDPMTTCPFQP
jgi:hypothetical protein